MLKIFKDKTLLFCIIIFSFTFSSYFLSNSTPLEWYNHYVHLSHSLLEFRIDVPYLPEYYVDTVKVDEKTILPFPLVPALALLPFVSFWGLETSQPIVAMFFGSLNTVLVFLLAKKLNKTIEESIFFSLVFAFGTVHWYASAIGTTWFLGHIVANFFLLLSLLAYLYNNIFSGIFLGLSALSRHPILFASLIFADLKNIKRTIKFLGPFFVILLFQFLYNYLRFGDFLETGYLDVYLSYASAEIPFYRSGIFSNLPNFGWLDIRNIPLHFFTMFAALPELINTFPFLKPSPYGLSILITSPILLFSFAAPIKEKLVRSSWSAVLLIALVNFTHYSQGWVQFGYRFALDFMPFLILLTILGIKRIKPIHIVLLVWSIVVNFWGVWWGVKSGW